MTSWTGINCSTSKAMQLLHVLWTRAVGTPGYDKAVWIALETEILEGEAARRSRPQGARR